jgi:hypothetical protein
VRVQQAAIFLQRAGHPFGQHRFRTHLRLSHVGCATS